MMSLLPYYPNRSCNPESMIRSFFDDPFVSEFFRRTPDTFFDRTPAVRRCVGGMMRVDVEDKGDSYLLTADMPGVQKENLKISVENGVLTIAARYNAETKESAPEGESERRYLYQERSTGSMSRSFSLEGIEEKDISAAYADGVLSVTLPKKFEEKAEGARRIEIR